MIKKTFACLALSGTSLGCFAHEAPSVAIEKSQPSTFFNVEDFILKTGQDVWFVNLPHLDFVTIGICFQYSGLLADPKDKPGLSSFLTHILTEGAGSYDKRHFNIKLLEHNINLNISSDDDHVYVIMKVPSKNLKEAFNLLKLCLTDPKLDDKVIERLKKQFAASLAQSLHFPQTIAKEKIRELIFGKDHVYATHTETLIKTIFSITREDLKSHLKIFNQSNANIAVVGNTSREDVQEILEDLLSSLPKGEKKNVESDGNLLNLGKIEYLKMDIPQTYIMYAHPGISRQDPDYYAADLLIDALGSGNFESRLWNEIREKRGLAYFVNTSLNKKASKYFVLGATGTNTKDVPEVIKHIKEQWKNVAEKGITEDELNLQKQNIMGSYPLSLSSSNDIAKALLALKTNNLPKEHLDKRNSYYEKVTLEDINRVEKRLLKAEELTFVVVGKTS